MKCPDNAAAVPLYLGMAMRSAIDDVEFIGPPSGPYGVHGITVAGSNQETRRYSAILGLILGYDSVTGNISKDGISFYTRGQGKDVNFGPPPGMWINALYHTSEILIQFAVQTAKTTTSTNPMSALMSSVALHAPVSHTRGYPASRSFDDKSV